MAVSIGGVTISALIDFTSEVFMANSVALMAYGWIGVALLWRPGGSHPRSRASVEADAFHLLEEQA